MKRVVWLASIWFLFNTLLFAQEKGFGAGIILGEPTGISAKYWINEQAAFDIGVAYSFFSANKSVSLHSDYLFHLSPIFIKKQKLLPYYGYGVRIHLTKKISIGARGVVGLAWIYLPKSSDVFFELAPVFCFLPKTNLSFDVSLGARYYLEF